MDALTKKQARKSRRTARNAGLTGQEYKVFCKDLSKAGTHATWLFDKIDGMNAEIKQGVQGVAKAKRKLSDTVRREGVNLGDFWNPTCKRFVR